MEPVTILELIGSYGFPVVVAVLLMWYVKTREDTHDAQILDLQAKFTELSVKFVDSFNKNTEALRRNTEILDKLSERIERGP